MPDTNMDINKNRNATAPVFEFTLPQSEVGAPLEVGMRGSIIVPVEVVAMTNSAVTFRKRLSASLGDDFKPETSDEMKERIGVVEEFEKPFKDDSED